MSAVLHVITTENREINAVRSELGELLNETRQGSSSLSLESSCRPGEASRPVNPDRRESRKNS